ncbi:IS66-like element accessory protein TnpA [Acidiphilium iwatense]|uniref:IS66-like element accessory protein TnpA n=1 Tax=Acidiphilium iwatense TaxID=768198 RepID=UPI0022A77080|nr:transposase [Acidiphilium iwatense]
MDDVNDDAKGLYRRVEVLTGSGRRRRWSVDEKARIVAESLVPGAVVSRVARRWQVCPQQIFGWRRLLVPETCGGPGGDASDDRTAPAFVRIVGEPAALAVPTPSPPPPAPAVAGIAIEVSGAIIRVAAGVDAKSLTAVLRAVRASGH